MYASNSASLTGRYFQVLVNKEPPGVMHVPAQMDLVPPEEMMSRNVHELEARIVGRVVTNGADVASDLRSQRPANAPHVVVRIVVPLQKDDLARDLREIEVRLVASGLRPTVLAVVHEVADMDEQIVQLAALVDPANQRSVVLGYGLERTVRPIDNARRLSALEVEIAGEKSLH